MPLPLLDASELSDAIGKVGATHLLASAAIVAYLTKKIRIIPTPNEGAIMPQSQEANYRPQPVQFFNLVQANAASPGLREDHIRAVYEHRRGWIRIAWSFCIDLRHRLPETYYCAKVPHANLPENT